MMPQELLPTHHIQIIFISFIFFFMFLFFLFSFILFSFFRLLYFFCLLNSFHQFHLLYLLYYRPLHHLPLFVFISSSFSLQQRPHTPRPHTHTLHTGRTTHHSTGSGRARGETSHSPQALPKAAQVTLGDRTKELHRPLTSPGLHAPPSPGSPLPATA